MTRSLFSEPENNAVNKEAPLAERLRPNSLDEIVGQQHLIGPGKVIRMMAEQDRLASIILWGPPRHGENNAGPYSGPPDPFAFCCLQCGPVGHKGNQDRYG